MINRGPQDGDTFKWIYSDNTSGFVSGPKYPELSAMWNTPVTEEDILAGRSHRYDFFNNILNDIRVTNLIYNATNSDLREL